MQIKATQTFTATLLIALASNVLSFGIPSSGNGQYNFDYAVFGEGKSRPVQVFDDGVNTYLQYKVGSDIPALMSANGDRKFNYELDGPYAVIKGTPRDLIAQFGVSKTRIVHSSLTSNAAQYSKTGQFAPIKSTESRIGDGYRRAMLASNSYADPALAQSDRALLANSWQDNSYAIPKKGDHVQWSAVNANVQNVLFAKGSTKLTRDGNKAIAELVKQLDQTSQISVVGSDDDSFKEKLGESRAHILKETLIKFGVDASLIALKTTTPSVSELVKNGSQIFTPSFIKWHVAPIQSTAQQDTAPQVEIARQLASGTISPGMAAERLQEIEKTLTQRQVEAPQIPKRFLIKTTDATVDALLRRWGAEYGWQVISKDAPEIKINGEAELIKTDFIKAADVVVSQARVAGYRINASAYSNKVLVITKDEQK